MVSRRWLASVPAMTANVDPTEGCVFCGIVAGTIPCAKVAEDAMTFAFMDIDPGSDGHALVCRNGTALTSSRFPPMIWLRQRSLPSGSPESHSPNSALTASTCSTAPALKPGRPSSTSTCTSSRAFAIKTKTGFNCRSSPAYPVMLVPSQS